MPAGAGAIGLLSGDEFTPAVDAFDTALIAETGRRIAILLCADPRAAPYSAKLAMAHYRRLGADPYVVDVLHRTDATADALGEYDVLFLGGGSPADLLDALLGTPLWDEALRRWRAGAALAGASAGAMALCTHCLLPKPGADKPTEWSEGLGPIVTAGLAVHASSRPPEWLHDLIRSAPVPVIALDDATGVLVTAEWPPEVHGPGRVRVYDPLA